MWRNVEQGLDYHDVLVKPKFSYSPFKSRAEVQLWSSAIHKNRYFGFSSRKLPIVVANMEGIGTLDFAKRMKYGISTALQKTRHPILDLHRSNNTWHVMGEEDEELDFIKRHNSFLSINLVIICYDVANAYRQATIDRIKQIKEILPYNVLIVGNVASYEGAIALFKAGADGVKGPIGNGSVCLTRSVTGIGAPTISAILELRKAADSFWFKNKLVVADGGVQTTGDITKALVAGADYVMIGGMFAKTIPTNFRGSSIINDGKGYKTSEGKLVSITDPIKTPEELCDEIKAGLNSAATYLGTDDFSKFRKRGKLVRVTRQLNNLFG